MCKPIEDFSSVGFLFFFCRNPHICPLPWLYFERNTLSEKRYGMTASEREKIKTLQLQGLGYMEIAAMTNVPINTVKSFCYRHPVTESEIADANSVCRFCGTVLIPTPHKRKKHFCSDACRMAWWKAHPECLNRKAIYKITCAYCGRSFESYGNNHRKFCSRGCYVLARKQEAGR